MIAILIFAFAVLLIGYGIYREIADKEESDEQKEYVEELYKKCVETHGLEFSRKLLNGCLHPFIGIENTIMVLEHHCGVTNK